MAPANKNSNNNSTLPTPELNPLLNPVLGAHMGRWAEVYFTSAPEKRDEAVLDLLRELEGGSGSSSEGLAADKGQKEPQKSFDGQNRQKFESAPPRILDSPIRENPVPSGVVCDSCGGTSESGNRFCGMCGAPLEGVDPATARTEDSSPQRLIEYRSAPDFRRPYEERKPYENVDERDDRFAAYSAEPPRNSWPPRPDVPSLIPEYEAPYRYRIYVGAGIAILIAGLLYIAWHGAASTSGTSAQLPPPAPAAETQPARAQASPPSAQVTQDRATASNAVLPTDGAADAAASPRERAGAKSGTSAAPSSSAPPSATPSSPTQRGRVAAAASAPLQGNENGNGDEELSVAESYLNGTQGRARDSAEAAKWLWRSMGKQNAAATLLLSDLYLKGDGVPKSCDQARLLLDAAARKGAAGAAQRIRNFSAVGCQ